ncbi:MAG: DNA polymerase III subunit delta [Patescibacteria group bacterium]
MLYLLYGPDSFRSRKKLNDLLDFFRSRSENLDIFKFEKENFEQGNFEELMKICGLFGEKIIVISENIIKDKAIENFVINHAEEIKNSKNIFIFLEEDIGEEMIEIFRQYSNKIQEFKFLPPLKLKNFIEEKSKKISNIAVQRIIERCGPDLWCVSKKIEKYELGGELERVEKNNYNPFAVGDAVALKQKIKAWILFQEAILSGIDPEEIFWKILWQIKNLSLVKRLSSMKMKNIEKETGFHPYVVKKTLTNINSFSQEELNELSWQLIDVYHRSRNGQSDLSSGLENFILHIC